MNKTKKCVTNIKKIKKSQKIKLKKKKLSLFLALPQDVTFEVHLVKSQYQLTIHCLIEQKNIL